MKKKSLYEVKKAAVDDFMKVYDRGSRDDVFMYYNEVVDTTANMAEGLGKYKGSFYGLLTGLAIVGGIKLKKKIDKIKKEKEKTKKMEEFIARHEGEEA